MKMKAYPSARSCRRGRAKVEYCPTRRTAHPPPSSAMEALLPLESWRENSCRTFNLQKFLDPTLSTLLPTAIQQDHYSFPSDMRAPSNGNGSLQPSSKSLSRNMAAVTSSD
ncbi:hypothetical protein EYF80_061761 [Liparis tanakae]|uniref:Uncharacterized protein n=1 Tax=Liparis tanakae TaxID=230148 RepID=A0A4Z2EHD8_9TELE|nr:hypothetical protein EYF80_061761 [Liparis tanakae]